MYSVSNKEPARSQFRRSVSSSSPIAHPFIRFALLTYVGVTFKVRLGWGILDYHTYLPMDRAQTGNKRECEAGKATGKGIDDRSPVLTASLGGAGYGRGFGFVDRGGKQKHEDHWIGDCQHSLYSISVVFNE
jgi:hypothetical protein